MSVRHYLFPEEGQPLRMSLRLVEGLIFGKDSLPQFANTRQKVASVTLENDGAKPIRIMGTTGAYWEFDSTGGISDGLQRGLGEYMSAAFPTPPSNQTVVELRPKLAKKRLDEKHRWELGTSDIDRIVADIWPKKKADRVKAVQGVSKRRPPLSYDARHAIDEISSMFWKISHAIERLKESSLKSFGFEARARSLDDLDYSHLYRALADMADWELEVLKRKRTGRGDWYAVVDIMLWRDGMGETAERHYERCGSRKKAVLAARRLLARHAEKFNDYTTVEAELLTDLEWEKRAYSDNEVSAR